MWRRLISGLCIFGLGALVVVLWLILQPHTVTSPLPDSPWFGFANQVPSTLRPGKDMLVIGYLPYWNTTKVVLQPELSHLAYFSLTINGDGSIQTRDTDGNQEPGYGRLNSERWLELSEQARAQGTTIELTFTQLNNADIEAFLTSSTAQETFLKSLDSALLAYPVGGIHIDVEYTGSPTEALRNRFTTFIKTLDEHIATRYDALPLRIDVYPGAAEKYQLWDLPRLEPHVDSVIVMTYDFHRANSPVAGPVAPILGRGDLWEGDVTHYMQTILAQVPAEKVILGVPFYGYEWQTTQPKPLAATLPRTGGTASFDRVQQLLANPDLTVVQGWDDIALSPYLSYRTGGTTNFVFYENGRSLQYKLELAQQLEVGGIAIWALGYEGTHREFWDVIAEWQK